MKVPDTPQSCQRILDLGPDLQARATATASLDNGDVVAVDLRLYRRGRHDGPHLPTSAGFRVPLRSLRALGNGILDLAQELEELAQTLPRTKERGR